MATSTYLSQPQVTINAVSLADQVTSAVFTRVIEALDASSFGSNSRSYTAGMENSTLTVTLYNSYVASETYDTLKALVGTQVTVKVKPTSAAISATNVEHILTGAYLETLPLINGQLGALDTIDITFTGGVYSANITPPA
jgi:hypothetical protein